MEGLARLAGKRPVAVTVFAVVVIVLGIMSWRDLPLDLFPDIQSPTVLVSVTSGDRPAIEMERLYGERIEQQLFTVSGLNSITQVARSGRLITRITFGWDTDVDMALVEVNRAVSSISADQNVDEVRVRRFDPRQLPVLVLGLTAEAGAADLAEMRRIARRQLAPGLEQLDGIAEVRVSGGRVREVQVRVDRNRLESFGITVNQVSTSISDANVDVNAGTMEEGEQVLLFRGISRFVDPMDISEVVVLYAEGEQGQITPIRVGDLAEVVIGDAEIRSLVRVNGVEGIALSIYKEGGANTVRVSQTAREALDGLLADVPGVSAVTVTDEAALVEDAIADVESAGLLGIALAIGVLILYLRSAGPVVIVAVAVPVSLLATVFAMRLAGHSLNLMTLAGMALGAGMLVDNAIVVIESIFRRRAAGDSLLEASARGTGIVGGAITASTLTTCVVFLPVLFVEGMASKLVGGIAFTVVLSLLASLLVAIFLIPALCVWLLPRNRTHDVDPGSARVERLVFGLLARPWTPVLITALLAAIAIGGLARLGTELLPLSDPRQFTLRVIGTPGQRVESTAVIVSNIESILEDASDDSLAAILSEVGRLDDDDRVIREQQSQENTAEIRVRGVAGGPPVGQIIDAAAPAVEQLYGTEVQWQVGNSALSQALGTAGPPIVVEITGKSLDELRFGADAVKSRLDGRDEFWNVQTSFEGAPPELRLTLKRAVADGLGVNLQTVGSVLQAALDGLQVTTLSLGDEERDVVLTLPPVSVGELLELPFQSGDGRLLTIGDVAELHTVTGAREIFRSDQRRIARVTALVSPEYNAPQAREALQESLQNVELPPGLSASAAGDEVERQQTVEELQWAALLALMLVLMVIAGSFESLLHPVTILAAIPIALIGVAAVLVPGGEPLGIMVMLGMIVLVGVAVNDAILLAQMARRLILDGMDRRQALATAASLRLRPIVMTTATTCLALLPLALGGGEAAELRSPLALTVIGGIIASTIGSLTVIPCLYLILDRQKLFHARQHAREQVA